MFFAPLIVQDCGCISLPAELAASLGIVPGASLTLAVDAASRIITLTAPADRLAPKSAVPTRCAIKP